MFSIHPSSLHQPWRWSVPWTRHLYSLSLCPLLSLSRLELHTNQPLHLLPANICHLFSFCSSSNASLCLTIFTFLTVTRFRYYISLWSTNMSSWWITEHFAASASASNQHHCQNIMNLSSRLRLFCTKNLVKHPFWFCPGINRPF